MILFFCRVWIRLINLHLLCSWNKTNPMHLPEFDACPMHWALRASGIGQASKFSACALDLSYSLEKVNAHLLTSNHSYNCTMYLDLHWKPGRTTQSWSQYFSGAFKLHSPSTGIRSMLFCLSFMQIKKSIRLLMKSACMTLVSKKFWQEAAMVKYNFILQ